METTSKKPPSNLYKTAEAELAAALEMVANDLGPINYETCMQAASALRSLTRPVEDEEVRKRMFHVLAAPHRMSWDELNTDEQERINAVVRVANEMIAREKASAEHEAARLREGVARLDAARKVCERDGTPVPHYLIVEVCALASAAGTEG